MPPEKQETLKEEITDDVKALERRVLMFAAGLVLVVGGAAAAAAYLLVSSGQVYMDKAQIDAPEVDLAPAHAGILQDIFVEEGENIPPNTVVAQVGTELIKSTAGGLVISASKDIGRSVAAGTPVVVVVDPAELRVVGQLDEDKGLAYVSVGQRAVFTVDAFGGKRYEGVVSEVAPSSNQSDVVFSISDKREVKAFDVKVYYDQARYPELKNGMSARIWVYR